MKRILVLGAGGPAAQNFIESLRMADEDFYIVGTDLNFYQLQTTDLDARYHLPHTKHFTEELQHIVQTEKIEMVHAQPDVMVKRLAQRRDVVGARTFLPDDHILSACQDKLSTHRRLMGLTPSSVGIQTIEQVPAAFKEVSRGDAAVWVRAKEGAGSRAALCVRTAKQAKDWISYWCEEKNMFPGNFMFCRYLPGREYAWQSVWCEGKLVVSAARERLEYLFGHLRPTGQSSSPSLARTVNNEKVNDVAYKAIRGICQRPERESLCGIFCVDMKEDEEERPMVTEINAGRFFTTSNFFTHLGCNMPHIYTQLAYGEYDTVRAGKIPQFNAVPANYYWIRGVDRKPVLYDGREEVSKPGGGQA